MGRLRLMVRCGICGSLRGVPEAEAAAAAQREVSLDEQEDSMPTRLAVEMARPAKRQVVKCYRCGNEMNAADAVMTELPSPPQAARHRIDLLEVK